MDGMTFLFAMFGALMLAGVLAAALGSHYRHRNMH